MMFRLQQHGTSSIATGIELQLEGAGEIQIHWERCAGKESYTGLEGMLTFR